MQNIFGSKFYVEKTCGLRFWGIENNFCSKKENLNRSKVLMFAKEISHKQAGADLCQAHGKLNLFWP